jgi:hypothetical protein
LIGRLGDVIAFNDQPVELQTADLAALVGANAVGGGQWSCPGCMLTIQKPPTASQSTCFCTKTEIGRASCRERVY